jgi:hypothetical protein
MDEWGYAIAVVAGVIFSEAIRWFRDWRQGKEKYRVMLYEKRLEAHQGAFYHVEQLLNPLRDYFTGFGLSTLSTEMQQVYREAKKFYDSNCLYLDEQSRNEMELAIYRIRLFLEEPDNGLMENAFDQLRKAKKAIVSGIGMKHIEEPKKEKPEDKS